MSLVLKLMEKYGSIPHRAHGGNHSNSTDTMYINGVYLVPSACIPVTPCWLVWLLILPVCRFNFFCLFFRLDSFFRQYR